MTDSTNETRDGADPKVGGHHRRPLVHRPRRRARRQAQRHGFSSTATVVRVTIASASGLVPTGSAIEPPRARRVATRSPRRPERRRGRPWRWIAP